MIPEIEVDELAVRLADGATAVDVRETDEYLEAHVPGAQLVPLSELTERYEELPRGTALLLLCRSGVRSLRAAEFLASEGFDVTNVAGGTMAWMASGRDIATGAERG